jgi:multidrug efflux pump subunit AcrA (membrane-fusion protein)
MAQAAAAAAAEQAAAVEYTSKSKLLKRGAAGKDEARLAAAAHAKAKAEAEAANAVISGCELRAPFAGKMVEVNARPLELPPADRPLLIFLDGSSLELEMVAPSQWLGWLAVGTGFDFVVDETGRTYRGRVLRIGAEVDAISQTVRVVAEVDGTVEGLLAGMSGFARFAPQG